MIIQRINLNREGIINMFFETSQKWEKLNKRLEEYDKLFGEQERKEYQERKELRETLDSKPD